MESINPVAIGFIFEEILTSDNKSTRYLIELMG